MHETDTICAPYSLLYAETKDNAEKNVINIFCLALHFPRPTSSLHCYWQIQKIKKIFHQLLTNFLPSFLSPRQSKNKKFETKSEKKEREKKGVSKKTFVNQCKNSKQGKQKRGISECVRVWMGQKDFPTNKNC